MCEVGVCVLRVCLCESVSVLRGCVRRVCVWLWVCAAWVCVLRGCGEPRLCVFCVFCGCVFCWCVCVPWTPFVDVLRLCARPVCVSPFARECDPFVCVCDSKRVSKVFVIFGQHLGG